MTTNRYLANSGSLAVYSFSTWPVMTWESVLIVRILAPRAFAFVSASIRPSYSAMLLVDLNSSLAVYFSRTPEGASRTVEAPTPA